MASAHPTPAGPVAELSPAYFALVMATGIVSLAAHLQGLGLVAAALFGVSVVAWIVLWALNLLRAVRYPRRFFGDMVDHVRGPGYFAAVAGTAMLGDQIAMLTASYRCALAAWTLAYAGLLRRLRQRLRGMSVP